MKRRKIVRMIRRISKTAKRRETVRIAKTMISNHQSQMIRNLMSRRRSGRRSRKLSLMRSPSMLL